MRGLTFSINVHSILHLVQERDNKIDPFAAAICTNGGQRLGYIPAFYSNAVFYLIENGFSPIIRVVYVNEKSHPYWWVQVEFECEITLNMELLTSELFAVMVNRSQVILA